MRCPLQQTHLRAPDMEVRAIHIPTKKSNCFGWALEAVVAKARFGRTPKNSKLHVTMISMHCQNTCAKKRSIALTMLLAVRTIMWHEKVDIVSGDYNGASWRCKSRQQQQSTAKLEATLKNANLPVPRSSSPLRVAPEEFQVRGLMSAAL